MISINKIWEWIEEKLGSRLRPHVKPPLLTVPIALIATSSVNVAKMTTTTMMMKE